MAVQANGNGGQRVFQTMTLAISGLSLLMSLGFAFYTVSNPKGDMQQFRFEAREDLKKQDERLEAEILRIKLFAGEKLLTKDEHKEFVRRTDDGLQYLRDEIVRLRSDQVTRSEHQQHWTEIAERITSLREADVLTRRELTAQIDAVRKDTGGQYTLGDQIKNLQDQIKTLNARLDTRMRPMPATPPQ